MCYNLILLEPGPSSDTSQTVIFGINWPIFQVWYLLQLSLELLSHYHFHGQMGNWEQERVRADGHREGGGRKICNMV